MKSTPSYTKPIYSAGERLDHFIASTSTWNIATIDYEAGLKWCRCTRAWLVKLEGRSDRNAWMRDTNDYALAIAIRFIRDGRRHELKVIGPQDEIDRLVEIAEDFAMANRWA